MMVLGLVLGFSVVIRLKLEEISTPHQITNL